MKPVNKVFFGERGLTSSSANHICNVCKELIASTNYELGSLSFTKTSVSDFDGKKVHILKKGMPMSEEQIMSNLSKVTQAHSLIAYLREALKAKEDELNDVKNRKFECSVKEFKCSEEKAPERGEAFTVNDALGELNIKDRNEYYSLEAEASVIGKFIHPGSPFEEARAALIACCKTGDTELIEKHSTLLLQKTEPVSNLEDVESLYFKLQKKHREVSARFNSIKAKLQSRVDEENGSRNLDFKQKLDAYYSLYNKEYADYEALKAKEEAEFNDKVRKDLQTVSQLKIVVPNELEPIFNIVNAL